MTVANSPEGHDGPHCGAKKRQGTGTCTQAAGWGTDHVGEGRCKLHGGKTPTVSRGAQLRLAEAEARTLFGKLAPERRPVDNPLAEYAVFAGRVMAWMETMDALLDDLRTVSYESETAGEQIHGVIQLYERAMDRTNTVLAAYARLRIDDRLAAITEQQADMVVRALDAVIAYLGATGPRAIEARKVGAAHLRIAASE